MHAYISDPHVCACIFQAIKVPMLQLLHIRSASNPMDKGVCNSVNSEIQTWLPCTIIKVKLGYYAEAHA